MTAADLRAWLRHTGNTPLDRALTLASKAVTFLCAAFTVGAGLASGYFLALEMWK